MEIKTRCFETFLDGNVDVNWILIEGIFAVEFLMLNKTVKWIIIVRVNNMINCLFLEVQPLGRSVNEIKRKFIEQRNVNAIQTIPWVELKLDGTEKIIHD